MKSRCDKSVWYADLVFVLCTLLAQVVLTLRWEPVLSPYDSELIPTQNIRRVDGEHPDCDRVWSHYYFPIRSWDVYDGPHSKGGR